jgi:hypothetical protein
MDPETETANEDMTLEIVDTLREVRAFLDDPLALLERAVAVLRRREDGDR